MIKIFIILMYLVIICMLIKLLSCFMGDGFSGAIIKLIYVSILLFAIIFPLKRYFVDDRNILLLIEQDEISLARELEKNEYNPDSEDYTIWAEKQYGSMHVKIPLWWNNAMFLKKSNAFEEGCTYDFRGSEFFCCFCIDYSNVKAEAEREKNDGDAWTFLEESHIMDYIAQKIYKSNIYSGDSNMKFGVTSRMINGNGYTYYRGEKKESILEVFQKKVDDHIIVFAYGYNEDSSREKMSDVIRVIYTIEVQNVKDN